MYKVLVKYTEEERAAFIRKHEAEWQRVGSQIESTRKQLRISQKRLAKAAGICVNTLRKLERGKYITRFRTVAASCINSLKVIAYNDLLKAENHV